MIRDIIVFAARMFPIRNQYIYFQKLAEASGVQYVLLDRTVHLEPSILPFVQQVHIKGSLDSLLVHPVQRDTFVIKVHPIMNLDLMIVQLVIIVLTVLNMHPNIHARLENLIISPIVIV